MVGSRGAVDLISRPGHLIRRAQQLHTELWTEIVGGEVTSRQFAVLTVLREHPRIDQATLSRRVSLDTSTCQDIVARLGRRGLLDRTRDPADRRRWLVRLTAVGAHVLDRVDAHVRRTGEELLRPLDATERRDLLRLLRKVVDQGEAEHPIGRL